MEQIIFTLIGYVVGVTIMNVIIDKKGKSQYIKLPKPGKFRGRLSPIYKIHNDNLYDSDYFVEKWELGWSEDSYLLPILFIPFVFGVRRYKYIMKGSFCICTSDKFKEITQTAEQLWNEKNELRKEILDQDIEERNKKKDKLSELNKDFNENYI
jgi:hypothetical protein